MVHLPQAEQDPWRKLALSFHAVQFRVRTGQLVPEFEPLDLDRMTREVSLSSAEAGVMRFLLHVWSHRYFRFELCEVDRWDGEHRKAFIDWATGETTGYPCHFF